MRLQTLVNMLIFSCSNKLFLNETEEGGLEIFRKSKNKKNIERQRIVNKMKIATEKKQQQQKNMQFNRFLIFRYSTAFFFFINVYWIILSFTHLSVGIVLPILLLLMDLAIIIEQTKKYWQPSNQLKRTKQGYAIQISGNLVGLIALLFGKEELLFPFFSTAGRPLLVGLLILGIIVSLLIEWQAQRIENNKDRYQKYLLIYEKI